jgi:hypothetical protein
MTSATSSRARLERAYRRTAYAVEESSGAFALRIGIRSAELDALLNRYNARSWAFITAFNPDSEPLDARSNRRRQAALERSLTVTFLRGEGRSLVGNWKPETSVLLLGLSPQRAQRLACRWRQAAVVVGVRGGRPRLQWRRAHKGRHAG